MNNTNKTVVVLGASKKPERYSFKAVEMLLEGGYKVIPVNVSGGTVLGLPITKTLSDISEPVHTLSMYINPSLSDNLTDEIISLKPQRIIFNPGTENSVLSQKCQSAGIEITEACTLVLLRTKQF
jgi:predicted CoA-binding protein